MANFFNFNINDDDLRNAQLDVLEKKFKKWKNNPDSLTAERKVRGYVVEAIISFYNPSAQGARRYVESHPASSILTEMLNWLKDRGYKTAIRTNEGVVITSPRNTYVAEAFYPVSSNMPGCIGLMELIMSPRNRILMND